MQKHFLHAVGVAALSLLCACGTADKKEEVKPADQEQTAPADNKEASAAPTNVDTQLAQNAAPSTEEAQSTTPAQPAPAPEEQPATPAHPVPAPEEQPAVPAKA